MAVALVPAVVLVVAALSAGLDALGTGLDALSAGLDALSAGLAAAAFFLRGTRVVVGLLVQICARVVGFKATAEFLHSCREVEGVNLRTFPTALP